METTQHQARVGKAYSDGEETAKAQVDELGNLRVSDSYGYIIKVTPSGTALGDGVPCDAVFIDTTAATVTFEPAENDSASTVTLPLAPNQWHKVRALKITAVSTGNVWAAWYRRPPGT